MTVASDLVDLISPYRFVSRNEDALEAAVADLIVVNGYSCLRQELLDRRCRADIMVDNCLIELKVKGSRTEIVTQLQRYAQFDRVQEIILVTTRSQHRSMPMSISGKPVHVVHVGGGL